MRNSKGFTLVELLVVVAIVAILISTSIPIYNYYLEDSRIKADTANERAALDLAKTEYALRVREDPMFFTSTYSPWVTPNGNNESGRAYYYKIKDGKGSLELITTGSVAVMPWVPAWNFDTVPDEGVNYGQCSQHRRGDIQTSYLAVWINNGGEVSLAWNYDGGVDSAGVKWCNWWAVTTGTSVAGAAQTPHIGKTNSYVAS